ncbi:MAG: hypothetical protein KIY12_06590 [Thermoplasmata archaeon]|uniref:DUF8156 domain-containing protein n=1 Tax=Candidatus Sysuiplasma superficiale TaxID=2823368 RepID=A0A8J7YTJ4_9ARCH|nr:hypothetical protein [Candidatus Sysuiplasma superficiale]MBX8644369.1 hypothetical protein [Candidatus Sysuiplasma superficiale]MCL4347070.1 hypothetical protein [Candidatus Thermoplasmatota archaeon]MCL5437495.1 hypothetical protein [Candidatus Thermoplasmatota archaeon]
MGRTVPTFREEMERIVARWEKFGRAMRSEDRPYLERVISKARRNAAASSYSAMLNPVEGMLLSVLIEQEKEIDGLRNRYRF